MSDDERLMGHEYDGIREYDNPTPGWWKGIFLASVVYAVVYVIWFHGGGPGKSDQEEYALARARYDAQRAEQAAVEAASVNEASLAALAADAEARGRGEAVFLLRCQACHTENGRGLVGPNLTDEFQIHGTSRLDIFQTVRDGVAAKGMAAWGQVLPPDELMAVAAFVSTLRGSNLPGGKAAEGGAVGAFAP